MSQAEELRQLREDFDKLKEENTQLISRNLQLSDQLCLWFEMRQRVNWLKEELQKLAASYGADLDTVKNIFVGKERERMEEDIAVQKAVSFVADHAVEVEKAEEAAETEEA